MDDDDGVDGIAAGLHALLGGSDSEEEGEDGDEGAATKKKGSAFVTERYARTAMRREGEKGSAGPVELELSLASSHHSLWGACRACVGRGKSHTTRNSTTRRPLASHSS